MLIRKDRTFFRRNQDGTSLCRTEQIAEIINKRRLHVRKDGHCTYGIWSFFHRTCIGRVWPLHTSVILCTPHRVPFHYAFFCTTIRSCAVLWFSPTLFGSLSVCIILLAKSKIRLNLVNTDCKKKLYFDKSLLYSQKMKEGSPLRLISFY